MRPHKLAELWDKSILDHLNRWILPKFLQHTDDLQADIFTARID